MLEFDLDISPEVARMAGVRSLILDQITALPRRGTPVADLTERDRMALALHAGVPYSTEMRGNMLHFRTTRLVGIMDGADGRYTVVIGPELGDNGVPKWPVKRMDAWS